MLTIDFSVLPPGSCRARRMCKVSKHVLRDRLGQCISASRRRQLHLRQCRSKAMRARDFILPSCSARRGASAGSSVVPGLCCCHLLSAAQAPASLQNSCTRTRGQPLSGAASQPPTPLSTMPSLLPCSFLPRPTSFLPRPTSFLPPVKMVLHIR